MPKQLSLSSGEQFSRTRTLLVTTDHNSSSVTVIESDDKLLLRLPSGIKLSDTEAQDVLMKKVIKIWRKEAKIYLPRRLGSLSKLHSLSHGDVRVKYMHTRWGSCSTKNNINLNIQLMRLKPELIDHVLLHELCHTKEHNHSKSFWKLFESVELGARKTSKRLKTYHLF